LKQCIERKNGCEEEESDKVEVVADWQLAYERPDLSTCWVKHMRGFLGETQLYYNSGSNLSVQVFPEAWEPTWGFRLACWVVMLWTTYTVGKRTND